MYKACFGTDGQKGQLVQVIDKKSVELIENRAKLGLPLIDENEAGEGGQTEKEKKKLAMAGRASKFISADDAGSILEDSNDEHSSSSGSESSFSVV